MLEAILLGSFLGAGRRRWVLKTYTGVALAIAAQRWPDMRTTISLTCAALAWLVAVGTAQPPRGVFVESRDHPAIAYTAGTTDTAIDRLNRRIREGAVTLQSEPTNGYLKSVLDALDVAVESQVLVFSETSFQAPLINIRNPRALYFADSVAVGWVRGADVLEAAATDSTQGVVLYQMTQDSAGVPQFTRNDECLLCHLSWETFGTPGLLALSTAPLPDENSYALGFFTDHRSPFRERWGGWFVTGDPGGSRHMGNVPVMPTDRDRSPIPEPEAPLASLEGLFDLEGYLSPHSDAVALLVLGHQARATNLLVRLGWEARLAVFNARAGSVDAGLERVGEAAADLVDYWLFVDEAPLGRGVRGSSEFAETFAAVGPRDDQGRSLRQFDLAKRMMRYPLSYMIYSETFDALPAAARDVVYARLWLVLSGEEQEPRYAHLSLADRRAVVEILKQTKDGLPGSFDGSIR